MSELEVMRCANDSDGDALENQTFVKETRKQQLIAALTEWVELTEEFGIEIWDEALVEQIRTWYLKYDENGFRFDLLSEELTR